MIQTRLIPTTGIAPGTGIVNRSPRGKITVRTVHVVYHNPPGCPAHVHVGYTEKGPLECYDHVATIEIIDEDAKEVKAA